MAWFGEFGVCPFNLDFHQPKKGKLMARLIASMLLSVFATLLLASALVIHLPFERGATLIWSGLLVPILWVVLVVYIYWTESRWRGLIVMAGVIVFSGLLIAIPGSGVIQ